MRAQIEGIPGLWVDLTRTGGGFQIAGQHLRGGGEYEYWLTIERADVDAFARALGVDRRGIEAAWGAQVQQIAREGEMTWLRRHDVPFAFFAYGDPAP